MEEEIVKDSNRTPKNPKKVKAGKASAKGRKKEKGEMSQVDISTIYNGLQSIAGLVATGFTLYHGWKFFWGPPKSEEVGESRIQSITRDEEVGSVSRGVLGSPRPLDPLRAEPATSSLPKKSSRKSAVIF